jgi:hypothetical protein
MSRPQNAPRRTSIGEASGEIARDRASQAVTTVREGSRDDAGVQYCRAPTAGTMVWYPNFMKGSTMPSRRVFFAALIATAALVVGAPAAGASTFPAAVGVTPPVGGNGAVASGVCGGTSTAGQGQGGTGGTTSQHCLGAGLSFTGPAIGQIASVIGPTIISPAVVGVAIVVSGGNGAVVP